MIHSDTQSTSTRYSVRELRLLEEERIEEQFVPEVGLVSDTPEKGPLLVLTNHRLISLVQSDGYSETLFADLNEVQGVSVKANSKGFRDLFQGLTLVFIGVLSYFILGYILDGVTIALALGAAIIFVGILFMAKYLFWEAEGSVTFQLSNWSMSLPYRSTDASEDIYKLVDRIFQLKLGLPVVQPSPTTAPETVQAESIAPSEEEPSDPDPFSPPHVNPLPPFSPTPSSSLYEANPQWREQTD